MDSVLGLVLHRLGDEFQNRQGRGIALADADLGDAGAATVTVLEGGGDLLEQFRHHIPVGHRLQHQATGVEVASLGLGDELLGQRLDAAGLGLGGGDTAVLEELGGQVAQDEALMGGATTQTGALGRLDRKSTRLNSSHLR